MSTPVELKKPARLKSLDTYRGMIMLAMASEGFHIARSIHREPALIGTFDGTAWAGVWQTVWTFLAYQLEHIAWGGCVFWDLIQPSFMFMVGVSMPYSFLARQSRGNSKRNMLAHAVRRAFILVALGVILYSIGKSAINFVFVNVLAQIGLGYLFVYLLLRRNVWVQLLAVAVVLGGYSLYFVQYNIPASEYAQFERYMSEVRNEPSEEWTFYSGFAHEHWDKHTNAAAGFDREWLNRFPRNESEWEGKRFWVNGGGYQTLNFIPSIATMIFGLMAGQLLIGACDPQDKLKRLLLAGFACFVVAMAVDPSLLPIPGFQSPWMICPAVKRIWTPTWTIFSAGWTFWMLAGLYGLIDIKGYQRWTKPFVVVGMNSIAMYCMASLIDGWLSGLIRTFLGTIDALGKTNLVSFFYDGSNLLGIVGHQSLVLFALWLICYWLYRQKIFIRI